MTRSLNCRHSGGTRTPPLFPNLKLRNVANNSTLKSMLTTDELVENPSLAICNDKVNKSLIGRSVSCGRKSKH